MRSYALSIAGFDPSGGAGITADIKTFEQHRVYGLGVCSAITLQTEDVFFDLRWENTSSILRALEVLLDRYPVSAIKTGILPTVECLHEIVDFVISKNSMIKIVVDPVFRSSTGFDFINDFNKALFYETLGKCVLSTPNRLEAIAITGCNDAKAAALEMAKHCSVLLKGGHSSDDLGTDLLFEENEVTRFEPSQIGVTGKHGSGCILSAAITARLAMGLPLVEACSLSKKYVEKALASNDSLLAYHVS